jgi:Tfp pilus assembly protein PilO
MMRRTSERKVLLAVREGHLDARLLAAARSLCQRMEAELDILVLTRGEQLPAEVDELVAALRREGVAYSLTRKPVLRRRDVVDYANTHECISAVVIDSLEGWESVAQDRSSDPWRKLACPLVTASPSRTAAHEKPI